MKRALRFIGWTWIVVWVVLFFSAGTTSLFGIPHPISVLDNLGWTWFGDWRLIIIWLALIPGMVLIGATGFDTFRLGDDKTKAADD